MDMDDEALIQAKRDARRHCLETFEIVDTNVLFTVGDDSHFDSTKEVRFFQSAFQPT